MKTQTKVPSLIQAILPLIVLIALLSFNVSYFDDPLGGSNQIALIIAASICSILALFNHVSWHEIQRKILQTIDSAMTAILILLLIGSLSGSWMLSGVIPAMIYYGVDIMPVSYTHLDVYKRQILGSTPCFLSDLDFCQFLFAVACDGNQCPALYCRSFGLRFMCL